MQNVTETESPKRSKPRKLGTDEKERKRRKGKPVHAAPGAHARGLPSAIIGAIPLPPHAFAMIQANNTSSPSKLGPAFSISVAFSPFSEFLCTFKSRLGRRVGKDYGHPHANIWISSSARCSAFSSFVDFVQSLSRNSTRISMQTHGLLRILRPWFVANGSVHSQPSQGTLRPCILSAALQRQGRMPRSR